MRVRFTYQNLQRRIEALKEALGERLPADLRAAGEAAIRRLENLDESLLRRYISGQVWREFNAVFVGVQLKGTRPEQWPDLWPIYMARVVHRQDSYQGRRRFFVDQGKLDSLHARTVEFRLSREKRMKEGRWEIEVLRVPRGRGSVFRLIMRKRGKIGKEQREEVLTLVREQLLELSAAALTEALGQIGK